MRMEITHLHDEGSDAERLVLRATRRTDLGRYLLLGAHPAGRLDIDPEGAELIRWFLDQPLAAGDRVIVHSGPGQDRRERDAAGASTFRIYLDRPACWHRLVPVLVEAADWRAA